MNSCCHGLVGGCHKLLLHETRQRSHWREHSISQPTRQAAVYRQDTLCELEVAWSPVLLRDRAGEAALLSLEGPLLVGREGGRAEAGDGPLLTLGLSGRAGAALRTGLHSPHQKPL